jgi:hypothetical protein
MNSSFNGTRCRISIHVFEAIAREKGSVSSIGIRREKF